MLSWKDIESENPEEEFLLIEGAPDEIESKLAERGRDETIKACLLNESDCEACQ